MNTVTNITLVQHSRIPGALKLHPNKFEKGLKEFSNQIKIRERTNPGWFLKDCKSVYTSPEKPQFIVINESGLHFSLVRNFLNKQLAYANFANNFDSYKR